VQVLKQLDQDIYAGLFFIALGVLGLYLGADYAFGTTQRIGPGFLPKLLCWLMIGVGAVVVAIGAMRSQPLVMEPWAIGPLIAILCAVLTFTALLERQGLPISVAILVLVASTAMPEPNRLERALLLIGSLALLLWLTFNNLTIKSIVDHNVPSLQWLFSDAVALVLAVVTVITIGATLIMRLFTLKGRELVEVLGTAFVLAVGSVVVFTDALGLPMKVWPEWLPWN
jgi:hypothetical protein